MSEIATVIALICLVVTPIFLYLIGNQLATIIELLERERR